MEYQLTLPRAEHLITALDALTKYVVSLPDYQERLRKTATMTPAERAAQMEKDPKDRRHPQGQQPDRSRLPGRRAGSADGVDRRAGR